MLTNRSILLLFFCAVCLSAFTQDKYAPEKLGAAINTDHEESYPLLSPDGKTLFFGRQNDPESLGMTDIYFSKLGENGEWLPAKPFSEFNTAYENLVSGISSDQKWLLLFGSVQKPGAECSLAEQSVNGWGDPQTVVFDSILRGSNTFNIFMCADGKTIILAIAESYSSEHDLLVSFKKQDGHWTKPRNLGSTINTKSIEYSPFLASDMKTLYFASGKRGGEGGMDLYVSKRLDDTWTHWSKPVNLGKQINTSQDDYAYTVSPLGDYAYFSRGQVMNQLNATSDIYRIALPESLKPDPVVVVSGVAEGVRFSEGQNATLYFSNTTQKNVPVVQAAVNPATGQYTAILPAQYIYDKLEIQVSGQERKALSFQTTGEGKAIQISQNVDLGPLPAAEKTVPVKEEAPVRKEEPAAETVLSFKPILFDVRSYVLGPDAFAQLDRAASYLKKHPNTGILIEGHTDNTGSVSLNEQLSLKRAHEVRDYLISMGVSPNQLAVKSFGEEKPAAPNSTEEGKSQNRRVVLMMMMP